jgi:cobalt-zinc-cadmium efflux system protein
MMITLGIYRFFAPGTPIGSSMAIIAVLGIAFNAFSILVLGHNHSHGHSDSHGSGEGAHSHNHNHAMFSLHLWEDLWGWVAVLVGGLMIAYTGWAWVDPLLSVCISLVILRFAWKGLRGVQQILTQAYPPGFDPNKWTKKLGGIPGVAGIHDLHAWSVDGAQHVASVHVVCKEGHKVSDIKKAVRESFQKAGRFHVTIETESLPDSCT